MKYWLIKTEPETWSWKDQVEKKITAWDGVGNYQAAHNMRLMKEEDLCFFYHSGKERKIVGIVKVIKTAYPDPTDSTGRFVCVDVKYEKEIRNPITLQSIKSDKRFSHLPLVRQSRLSVMAIDDISWSSLCEMANISLA